MRRIYLLPLTTLALGLVAWSAALEAEQPEIPPIEVHQLSDTLHMLGSGMSTGAAADQADAIAHKTFIDADSNLPPCKPSDR